MTKQEFADACYNLVNYTQDEYNTRDKLFIKVYNLIKPELVNFNKLIEQVIVDALSNHEVNFEELLSTADILDVQYGKLIYLQVEDLIKDTFLEQKIKDSKASDIDMLVAEIYLNRMDLLANSKIEFKLVS